MFIVYITRFSKVHMRTAEDSSHQSLVLIISGSLPDVEGIWIARVLTFRQQRIATSRVGGNEYRLESAADRTARTSSVEYTPAKSVNTFTLNNLFRYRALQLGYIKMKEKLKEQQNYSDKYKLINLLHINTHKNVNKFMSKTSNIKQVKLPSRILIWIPLDC